MPYQGGAVDLQSVLEHTEPPRSQYFLKLPTRYGELRVDILSADPEQAMTNGLVGDDAVRAHALVNEAVGRAQQGDLIGAEAQLLDTVRRYPYCYEAFGVLSDVCTSLGRTADAVYYGRQVVGLVPSYRNLTLLARSLGQDGKLAEAATVQYHLWQTRSEAEPAEALEAIHGYLVTLSKLDDAAPMLDICGQALVEHPGDSTLRYQQAFANLLLQDLPEAHRLAEQALATLPPGEPLLPRFAQLRDSIAGQLGALPPASPAPSGPPLLSHPAPPPLGPPSLGAPALGPPSAGASSQGSPSGASSLDTRPSGPPSVGAPLSGASSQGGPPLGPPSSGARAHEPSSGAPSLGAPALGSSPLGPPALPELPSVPLPPGPRRQLDAPPPGAHAAPDAPPSDPLGLQPPHPPAGDLFTRPATAGPPSAPRPASPPAFGLREIVAAIEAGQLPPTDGGLTVVPGEGRAAVLAFTAHSVVAADVDPDWVRAQLPADDLGAPLNPPFLTALAARLGRTVHNIDLVAVAPRLLGPLPLPLAEVDIGQHPRVQRALLYRDDVHVWATEGGLLVLGRGVGGRWELAVEVDPAYRGRKLGRALATAGRHLVPGGTVWAQIAPGNAASVRAFLAAGFTPVGSEVLLVNQDQPA
jgi:hypothetical protein